MPLSHIPLPSLEEQRQMDAKSLGQMAYDAYGEHQAWLTYTGQPMPSWPSVRKDIQDAWQAAARAVAKAAVDAAMVRLREQVREE